MSLVDLLNQINWARTAQHTGRTHDAVREQTRFLREAEAARQAQVDLDAGYRYATDPGYRQFVDAHLVAQAQVRAAAAEAERDRLARGRARKWKIIGAVVALLFVRSHPVFTLVLAALAVTGYALFLGHRATQVARAEAERAQRIQQEAAAAGLTDEDRDWLRRYGAA